MVRERRKSTVTERTGMTIRGMIGILNRFRSEAATAEVGASTRGAEAAALVMIKTEEGILVQEIGTMTSTAVIGIDRRRDRRTTRRIRNKKRTVVLTTETVTVTHEAEMTAETTAEIETEIVRIGSATTEIDQGKEMVEE